MKIPLNFFQNNKVGTQCGTVGNTCFNDSNVQFIIDTFVKKIELVGDEWDGDSFTDLIEDGIYKLPSANVTFKDNIKLYGKLKKSYMKYYSEYYDGDVLDEDLKNDQDMIGTILMLKLGDGGGSWRYDGVVDSNVAYFESE